MKRTIIQVVLAVSVGVAGTAGAQGSKPLKKCAVDAVVSGTVCMDKYEASAWRVPNRLTVNKGLVTKIQSGKATVADLAAGGATQLGVGVVDDYAPCADGGANCVDVYAVSVSGVMPSSNVTWFQAQQACKNARKRLPSNAEWQAAVAGTSDPGPDNGTTDCNTAGTVAIAAGSRSGCVSSDGAFDMVGNLSEWVADWMPRSVACGSRSWGAVSPTGDSQCLNGAETTGDPGALLRGGSFTYGSSAGPLAVFGTEPSSSSYPTFGWRCAR